MLEAILEYRGLPPIRDDANRVLIMLQRFAAQYRINVFAMDITYGVRFVLCIENAQDRCYDIHLARIDVTPGSTIISTDERFPELLALKGLMHAYLLMCPSLYEVEYSSETLQLPEIDSTLLDYVKSLEEDQGDDWIIPLLAKIR